MANVLEIINIFLRLIKPVGFSFIKSPSQFVFNGNFLNNCKELNEKIKKNRFLNSYFQNIFS